MIKKFNEMNGNGITVYVVLLWYFDGDAYLVNSYGDCFIDIEEAKKYAESNKDNNIRIYMPDETIPDKDGVGQGAAFVQIIKKDF